MSAGGVETPDLTLVRSPAYPRHGKLRETFHDTHGSGGIIENTASNYIHQNDEAEDSNIDYWISYLRACRPAELLCDKPRPGTFPNQADELDFTITPHHYGVLQSLCQARGFTELTVLLAAFRVSHYRLTGATDAMLGVATADEASAGLIDGTASTNTLQAFQIHVDEESFDELVHRVQRFEYNKTIPFGKLMNTIRTNMSESKGPLIPILFHFHAKGDQRCLFTGPDVGSGASQLTSMFDVEFHLFQETQGLGGKIIFSAAMYERATMLNLASIFQNVLQGGIRQPKISVSSIPLMTDGDYSALDTMGLLATDSTAYPCYSSVIDIFHQQVVACPSKIAIKDSDSESTYTQLDLSSDTVASWLNRRALPAETMIGVLGDRTCRTVAIFLGILKANLAYLPFDIRSPVNRIETILSSIPGPKLLLVAQDVEPPILKLADVEIVRFEELLVNSTKKPSTTQEVTLGTAGTPTASSLAYVMFTSGSTGAPKGVMVEHRSIIRLVKESNLASRLPSTLIMAHLSNIAFDAATWEIYATLLNGGTLICIDAMTVLDYEALSDRFARESIQTAFLTTALFKQYIHDCPSVVSDLGMVCVGGERIDPQDLALGQKLMSGEFVHVYGPTENTTFSTMYPVSKQQSYITGVPIGRTISNSGAFVMDSKQHLVPLGVLGELVVTGDGLARGYTNPELNLNRFVTVEVCGKQLRAYRTGDMVRYQPTDGQLDFIGRLDGQVKINGNRVELGEIETMLRASGYVYDAAAVLQREGGFGAQLVCFVTLQPDAVSQYQTSRSMCGKYKYPPTQNTTLEKDSRDSTGWSSMENEKELKMGDMNGVPDDTIDTIIKGDQPKQIVEIGIGPGEVPLTLVNGLHPSTESGLSDGLSELFTDIQRQLKEMLRAKLPPYMIPKEIRILDKMPMNQNGKVDRQSLARRVPRRVAPKDCIRQPTTEAERQMQQIWSEVLNVSPSCFGLDHTFFDLGGTSIDAMRIVGQARKVGFDLSAQDIFRHKKLGTLVAESNLDPNRGAAALETISLIDPAEKESVLKDLDAHNLRIKSEAIVDVLPTTAMQDELLYCSTAWRQYIDHFYMDVENENIDLSTFEKNCTITVERFPILRTCFLRSMGKYWQFVLRELDSPLEIRHVDGDLDQCFHEFVLHDLQDLSEDEPPLAITLLRHQVQGTRLVVRLHHSQYDVISLPIIVKCLVESRDQPSSAYDAPTFSQFMGYVSQKRPMAIQYWKGLLRGASITQIKPKLRPAIETTELQPLRADAETNLPLLGDNSITLSTIVNSAWAVLLARLTGENDVAYWQTIVGRNSALRGVEDVVGPCISSAPSRVIFSSLKTPLELLHFMQDQLMAVGEADSLGRDIVAQCTDWPPGIMDSVIQHQSFGETASLNCFGAEREIRFFENPLLLEPYPWIASFAKDNRLCITLFATTGLVTIETANNLVRDLCGIVDKLVTGLDTPLQEWMESILLTV